MVELLAPAGNLEKLEIAIHYGADAVYLAGKSFSLRNFSGNFERDQMRDAIKIAHRANVKVYVACNIFARNRDQIDIGEHLKSLARYGADGVIISDPGVLLLARELIPEMPVHLSTQANTTNFNSIRFWMDAGVERIIVARELSLAEIRQMGQHGDVQLEAFIHGAMCISYSGRCLLSSFLSNREGNRGECTHPCRWKYAVVEESRPGQYLPIEEDDQGAYLFYSRDLCMIDHIPELMTSGINSFKIEGRMKGINYLATTVKIYREAIDAFLEDAENYRVKKEWLEELSKINLRGYCTGFYFGDPAQVTANYSKEKPPARQRFAGKILDTTGQAGTRVEIRNKVFQGDKVEIFRRNGPSAHDRINAIIDADGHQLPFAQPQSRVNLVMLGNYASNDLIRLQNAT
jgi:putative protease